MPQSPSKLWLSFRSSTQLSTVLQSSLVQLPFPCFIILAYPFMSPFLIPFPHVFHVPLFVLFYVLHSRILNPDCYVPSRPWDAPSLGDHTMGYGTSASPVIHSIRHQDYSVYLSVPKFCSPPRFMFFNFILFHVSISIRIFISLFYFWSPNPNPDICSILVTLICCYTLSHPKTCRISVTML